MRQAASLKAALDLPPDTPCRSCLPRTFCFDEPSISSGTETQKNALDRRDLQKLARAIENGDPLTTLANELEFDCERSLLQAVASSMGMHFADLDATEVDGSLLDEFPLRLIHRFEVFPIQKDEEALTVAVSNPFDFQAIDTIGTATRSIVKPVLAEADQLRELIKSYLGVGAETLDGLIALQKETHGETRALDQQDLEDAEQAQQASVVRLVNEILMEAIEARASDIHIESQERGIKLRYRIDGVLQKQPIAPEMNQFRAAIVSRLKIMANLNIAEKRIPQDGRIKLRLRGREVDIRVSVIPMLHGEGIVMRVLDKDNLSFSLRGIGMPEDVYLKFQSLIRMPHGIVLVTGPTGSGKTTTLYSALSEIKNEETKIITTEDPIRVSARGDQPDSGP